MENVKPKVKRIEKIDEIKLIAKSEKFILRLYTKGKKVYFESVRRLVDTERDRIQIWGAIVPPYRIENRTLANFIRQYGKSIKDYKEFCILLSIFFKFYRTENK